MAAGARVLDAAGVESTVADDERQPLIDCEILEEILEEILADGGKEEGLLELFVSQSHARLQGLAKAVDERDVAAPRVWRIAIWW